MNLVYCVRMKLSLKFIYGVLSLTISLIFVEAVLVQTASAATFNPNLIISDEDMTDYRRMSASAIQSFLNEKGGILATYRTKDVDGIDKSAAEIIYGAAYRNRLNPQFLLAHMQKESSLITSQNGSLLDWALGFGVCDSCNKNDPGVAKYKGFANQVDAASDRFRNGYLADLQSKNSTISGWGVGVSKTTLDGIVITPGNMATATLYTYTPWLGYHGGNPNVGGNSLFFDIMERYFPNRTSLIIEYPNSTLFQNVNTGSVYRLENGALRPITSRAALLSNYDVTHIVVVDDAVIARYPIGSDISYPKFIFVQAPTGGVYMIDQEHRRRAITSREMLRTLGVNPGEIIPLSQADIDKIEENPPITESDKYPLGALVQNSQTGAIMYFDPKTQLHPIWSKEIMENQFLGYNINQESTEIFEKYEVGGPVKFSDGTLVKIPERDTIYIIADGKKRAVRAGDVLEQLGGFSNVVETSKPVLQLHDTGKDFEFTKSTDLKKTKNNKKKKNVKKNTKKKNKK